MRSNAARREEIETRDDRKVVRKLESVDGCGRWRHGKLASFCGLAEFCKVDCPNRTDKALD